MLSTRSIRQQILDMFSKKRNSTIVTLYTKTKPSLKAGCPFGNLTKVSRINCVLNSDYSAAMSKLGKVINQRSWGKKLTNSLITHNKNKYLSVRPIHSKSIYMDGTKQIPYEQIKYYLKEFSFQSVPIRTYNINNIIGIKSAGALTVNKGEEKLVELLNA